ncbi:TPA: phage holin [Raoultella terrigena]
MKMPDKIFSAASYCTSGGLICTGLARTFDWFHGLDWNFIALASGVIIGVATYLTNLYYKRRWTKMYQQSLDRGYGGQPPQDN